MSSFRFKQFEIRQDETPMKVGTDGVLLGAWTRLLPTDRRILDIGTGTGLIALMLAQRAPEAAVTGIDIAPVAEARRNADASPWAGRIDFVQTPVQRFEGGLFDLIVSNPPFFAESLRCPDRGRTTARHTVELPFDELHAAVLRLLAPAGRFALVLPVTEADRFAALCAETLRMVRCTEVRTTPRRPAKRMLMEWQRPTAGPMAPECATLTIGTGEAECYTEEYRALTRDFYLKF